MLLAGPPPCMTRLLKITGLDRYLAVTAVSQPAGSLATAGSSMRVRSAMSEVATALGSAGPGTIVEQAISLIFIGTMVTVVRRCDIVIDRRRWRRVAGHAPWAGWPEGGPRVAHASCGCCQTVVARASVLVVDSSRTINSRLDPWSWLRVVAPQHVVLALWRAAGRGTNPVAFLAGLSTPDWRAGPGIGGSRGSRADGRRAWQGDFGDEVEPAAGVAGGEPSAGGLDPGGEVGQAAAAAISGRRHGTVAAGGRQGCAVAGLGTFDRPVVADPQLQRAVLVGGLDRAARCGGMPQDVGDGFAQHGCQHGVRQLGQLR